jgi:hypothetical protein
MANIDDNINDNINGSINDNINDNIDCNIDDNIGGKYMHHLITPRLNKIYFNIKNGSYEVILMWMLLIMTIVISLLLVISELEDSEETRRVI